MVGAWPSEYMPIPEILELPNLKHLGNGLDKARGQSWKFVVSRGQRLDTAERGSKEEVEVFAR